MLSEIKAVSVLQSCSILHPSTKYMSGTLCKCFANSSQKC